MKPLFSYELLKEVAQAEAVPVSYLREGLRQGTIVILRSHRHNCIPVAIGRGLRTKVNANIGTSPACASCAQELAKLRAACRAGADTVMDLSTGGNIPVIRQRILRAARVPVGTVPLYEACFAARQKRKSFVELSSDELLQVVEHHCQDGVDFITVHCGIRLAALNTLRKCRRLTGVVSRGGSLILEWMKHNRQENPLYARYDEILAMAREYRVCLSLGDGLRPGSLHDATDEAQLTELMVIGELVERARTAGVMAMVEGPGHVPLSDVAANVRLAKRLTGNAPFYVLGPLVTDSACGYDHISAAIGGAIASYEGADFLCYVTPSEHLGLPTIADVTEGVIACRIAAHAGDLARGNRNAWKRDEEISRARATLNWQEMIRRCLYPAQARKVYRRYSGSQDRKTAVCTMCGEFCAVKKSLELLKDEEL